MGSRLNNTGTLHFDDQDFGTYSSSNIHEVLKTLTALALILVPAFFILDFYTMPKDLLQRFGLYRLTATAIVIAQYILIRQTKPSKLSYLHGYFFSVIVGGMIALMTVELGGFDSRYYAGLNLVIFGVNLFLPWKTRHSAINSIIIISMYLFLNIMTGQEYSSAILINNLFFLFSTAIIAVSITYVKHKLVEQEFYLLVQLRNARDALWSEIELAKRIQTALLPDKELLKGFEIAAMMVPAKQVGGDYYDIVETPNGGKWVTIGDVSGHGIDSGLIMMMAQTSILSMINSSLNVKPSEVLAQVNKVMRENISRLGSEHYMTMMAIHLSDSQMTVAGKHQDVIIHRSFMNKTEVVPTDGTWLGISDEIRDYLKDATIKIGADDIVLLFTDGITEATNKDGAMYGQERLEQALNRYADLPVGKLVDRIIEEVKAFQEEQLDDMTLVAIKKRSS
ncbi:MAG: PP2C family protein-serine/threonine phosphatase [Desulfobacteraceae bacterium]